MNTFHIDPAGRLANEAAPEVKDLILEGFKYIAVRGANDGHIDYVYGVWPAPADWQSTDYLWSYVDARVWLQQYQHARSLA